MVCAKPALVGDDRLRVQLGAPVGRQARVDHRRRRDVDEVAHAGRRGRGDDVGGAAPVDRVVVVGDRGARMTAARWRTASTPATAAAERRRRRGCRPPTISQPVPSSRARSGSPGSTSPRTRQPVGRQPPHEPPPHLARRAGDQHRAPHRAPPPEPASADQSIGLKSPTASSREASSQTTTRLAGQAILAARERVEEHPPGRVRAGVVLRDHVDVAIERARQLRRRAPRSCPSPSARG